MDPGLEARNNRSMRMLAPAKLNRFLAVLGRREDGFHALELVTTVLEGASGLTDVLDAQPAEVHTLQIEGPMAGGLGAGEDNLVLRAWRLLEREAGRPLPASLRLEKHIPSGGGLGGGSSDAAAALRLGDALFGLGLESGRLLALAAELGSDVPLFLLGGTVLGLDRGERVFPLAPLALEPILIVHPGLHVPTPAVYKALAVAGYPPVQPCPSLAAGAAPPWRNDLTGAALRVCPALAEVQGALANSGGDALLCGSGSCWAARYGTRELRDAAAASLGRAHPAWRVWCL